MFGCLRQDWTYTLTVRSLTRQQGFNYASIRRPILQYDFVLPILFKTTSMIETKKQFIKLAQEQKSDTTDLLSHVTGRIRQKDVQGTVFGPFHRVPTMAWGIQKGHGFCLRFNATGRGYKKIKFSKTIFHQFSSLNRQFS